MDITDPGNVWTDAGGGYFANQDGHRARSHNLPCAFGGSKHDYESWGLDVRNFGAAGFWDCEIFVCIHCTRTKQGKRISPN